MIDFSKLDLFIFDMDGTLVDSALDFDAMRQELGFPKDAPILEHIEILDLEEQERAFEIVNRHEHEGALRAVAMPGIEKLLEGLSEHGKQLALLTRNSKVVTETTLAKFNWKFDLVLTRDCITLQKPHPQGLLKICEELNIETKNACYIGDFKFDLEAATNAKMLGILYDRSGNCEFKELADMVYQSHLDLLNMLK
ncbi:MAG: HAD family hydrolase [Deltaproteobacteria bacterium]|nr:MAG: HAD family hydrolase [Deltaproteobacteria bacterium]